MDMNNLFERIFERTIAFETDDTITTEEEDEIADLVKQVLTRTKENRKVRLITDLDLIGKEL